MLPVRHKAEHAVLLLIEFCGKAAKGQNMDDLLRGVPYTDHEAGYTYFRGADFIEYLKRNHGPRLDERVVYKYLREWGVKHDFKVLKGKGTNYWAVPWQEEDEQKEEFDKPKGEQEM